jgi:hypothetical protein
MTDTQRYCAQCGAYNDRRPHNKRFCSRACYLAYQRDHADRSPAGRARRRRRLAEEYAAGVIDEEAYREKLALYREEDLI